MQMSRTIALCTDICTTELTDLPKKAILPIRPFIANCVDGQYLSFVSQPKRKQVPQRKGDESYQFQSKYCLPQAWHAVFWCLQVRIVLQLLGMFNNYRSAAYQWLRDEPDWTELRGLLPLSSVRSTFLFSLSTFSLIFLGFDGQSNLFHIKS